MYKIYRQQEYLLLYINTVLIYYIVQKVIVRPKQTKIKNKYCNILIVYYINSKLYFLINK